MLFCLRLVAVLYGFSLTQLKCYVYFLSDTIADISIFRFYDFLVRIEDISQKCFTIYFLMNSSCRITEKS